MIAKATTRARYSSGLIVGITALLALTACGSRRDAQEFVQANQAVVAAPTNTSAPGPAPADTSGSPVTSTDSGTAVSPAAPATARGTSTATTTKQGTTAAPSTGTKPGVAAQTRTNPASPSNKCATSGSVVTIGNISTQSGFLGELFKGLPEALQVWAKQANACGGLGGHPVRVVSADDGADPATALTIAKRMVENDKVVAFIAFDNPLSVAGVEKYLAEVKVPEIGGDSSELPYFTNPMFFPIGPFVSVIGAADAAIAIDKGAKKIAVYYCAEVPNSCSKIAATKELQVGSPLVKAMGGDIVISQQASVVAPSFTSQCIAAKRAGADAIIAILDGPSVGRMATNCAAQNYTPTMLGISLGLSGNLTSYPALNNKFFAPLNTFPWVDTSLPATKKFAEDMQTYLGRQLSGPSPAMGYASGMLAQTAARAGLPANPTAADMIKGLYTLKNETLGGLTAPLTFTPQVPRKGIGTCYFLVAIENGQYTASRKAQCLPVKAENPK